MFYFFIVSVDWLDEQTIYWTTGKLNWKLKVGWKFVSIDGKLVVEIPVQQSQFRPNLMRYWLLWFGSVETDQILVESGQFILRSCSGTSTTVVLRRFLFQDLALGLLFAHLVMLLVVSMLDKQQ